MVLRWADKGEAGSVSRCQGEQRSSLEPYGLDAEGLRPHSLPGMWHGGKRQQICKPGCNDENRCPPFTELLLRANTMYTLYY